jgi:hypothetical protein
MAHYINELRATSRPSFSPTLAPSNFFLSDSPKSELHVTEFMAKDDLLAETREILIEKSDKLLKAVFIEWEKRLQTS